MKELRRKLFVSVITLMLVVMALGTSTFAWFSMNKEVTATGMQVTATAEGSLIIKQGAFPAANDGMVEVNFADASATALFASTHSEDYANYASGLMYVTNPEKINASTGLGNEELTYANAVNTTNPTTKNYYKDYTVYIAAAGQQMANQDLTITITNPTGVTNLNGAISVDFYYALNNTPNIESATYAGALNLVGLDPTINDAATAKTSVVLSNITIPVANGSSGYVIIMRVYVDGALKDSASTTYIKTINASQIANQTLTVKFTASNHQN